MTPKRIPAGGELGVLGGRFGDTRPLTASELSVPTNMQMADGALFWSFRYRSGEVRAKTVRPSKGLLQGFLALPDAPDDEIFNYAQRWGVLDICEHDLPASHAADCSPRTAGKHFFWEPLSIWRQFAMLFRSVLVIADRMQSASRIRQAEWEALYKAMGLERSIALYPRYGNYERLKIVLNVLISNARIRPVVEHRPTGWQVQFSAESALFGTLVCQLLLAATGTDGILICSACGLGFVPEKRPNLDRRVYCATCRRSGLPQRDAARDYRKRKKIGG